jgi:hypothetical protein
MGMGMWQQAMRLMGPALGDAGLTLVDGATRPRGATGPKRRRRTWRRRGGKRTVSGHSSSGSKGRAGPWAGAHVPTNPPQVLGRAARREASVTCPVGGRRGGATDLPLVEAHPYPGWLCLQAKVRFGGLVGGREVSCG